MVRLILSSLLGCLPHSGPPSPPPQWVAVTAPAFREALQPLCKQRVTQGMRVVVVDVSEHLTAEEIRKGDAAKLRRRVNDLCRQHKGKSYVLLVGAVGADRDAERTVVPPMMGTAGRMRGQPSDNGYGCLGNSLLPEVAVGRLPARTPAEAEMMIQRTIAYEIDNKPGTWRRRLTLLAGSPAFNPATDALVERLALGRLTRLDPSWTGVAVYDNPSSRFSLPAAELNRRARRYVEAGQAVTLFFGHSDAKGFASSAPKFLDRADWSELAIQQGPGIFATFGCFGCQLRGFDGEGYGVAAIRNPKGPVAVIGSHGECFAGMVDLALDGCLDSLFGNDPPERFGEVWLKMKAGLAKKPLPLYFPLLDAVDGDPKIPAATQRLEHLEMFVLLGDPALRLPTIRRDVRVTARGKVAPGGELEITGEVSARLRGGRVRITLERPLTSMLDKAPPLPKGDAERDEALLRRHERANNFILQSTETTSSGSRFTTRLDLPKELPWPRLTLRVYAATENEDGLAVITLPVQKHGVSPR